MCDHIVLYVYKPVQYVVWVRVCIRAKIIQECVPLDVSGYMPVTVCMSVCVCVRERAVSVLHPNRQQISQQPHLYAPYNLLCDTSIWVCARVCVCVCVRATEDQSVNKQQLVKSEGMTRCLERDKDRQTEEEERDRKEGERGREREFIRFMEENGGNVNGLTASLQRKCWNREQEKDEVRR